MKTLLFTGLALFILMKAPGQNVGIGTATPSEKLDINGNLNVAGQLKLGGDSGQATQVLMKNEDNNPVWMDIKEFKMQAVFDCTVPTSVFGAGNCNFSWTVPPGVRTIAVEVWGGGGGGGAMSAGGGGGYQTARFPVTPGLAISIVAGASGRFGSSTSGGIPGGTSSCTVNGVTVAAFGGTGGDQRDPFTTTNITTAAPAGGEFNSVPLQFSPVGYWGSPGGVSQTTFVQVSPTEFARVVHYAKGGGTAFHRNEGGDGGYRFFSSSILQASSAHPKASGPGCGGGADYSFGYNGRGGRVIIHY